jgi:hypothetical protein
MRWSRKRLGSTPAGRRIDFGVVERTGLTRIGRPLQRNLGGVVHRVSQSGLKTGGAASMSGACSTIVKIASEVN